MRFPATLKKIVPVGNIWGGLICAAISVIMVRAVMPIVDAIFGMWADGTMKTFGYVILWFTLFCVMYIGVWLKFLEPQPEDQEDII